MSCISRRGRRTEGGDEYRQEHGVSCSGDDMQSGRQQTGRSPLSGRPVVRFRPGLLGYVPGFGDCGDCVWPGGVDIWPVDPADPARGDVPV
jgi:hypothetical protein